MCARKSKGKNILRITFALFFVIFAGYSYSLGQEASNPTGIDLPIPLQEGSKAEGLITIYKGELKVIAVDNPTRVVISNPSVADVTSISKDEMLIVAKEAGTTNLIWWDSQGEHAAQFEVFFENMSPVKER